MVGSVLDLPRAGGRRLSPRLSMAVTVGREVGGPGTMCLLLRWTLLSWSQRDCGLGVRAGPMGSIGSPTESFAWGGSTPSSTSGGELLSRCFFFGGIARARLAQTLLPIRFATTN